MIRGTCDPAFRAVREAFAANFEHGEVGAACSVTIEGQVVVDIWGGWADVDHQREWTHDTMVNAYSVGKPVVALMLLQLAERGRVELDATADRWWPELRLVHEARFPRIKRLADSDFDAAPTINPATISALAARGIS